MSKRISSTIKKQKNIPSLIFTTAVMNKSNLKLSQIYILKTDIMIKPHIIQLLTEIYGGSTRIKISKMMKRYWNITSKIKI